jgi:hypothetical protein
LDSEQYFGSAIKLDFFSNIGVFVNPCNSASASSSASHTHIPTLLKEISYDLNWLFRKGSNDDPASKKLGTYNIPIRTLINTALDGLWHRENLLPLIPTGVIVAKRSGGTMLGDKYFGKSDVETSSNSVVYYDSNDHLPLSSCILKDDEYIFSLEFNKQNIEMKAKFLLAMVTIIKI